MVERVGGCGKSDGHRHGVGLATTTLLIYKFNGPTAQRPNGPTAQRRPEPAEGRPNAQAKQEGHLVLRVHDGTNATEFIWCEDSGE